MNQPELEADYLPPSSADLSISGATFLFFPQDTFTLTLSTAFTNRTHSVLNMTVPTAVHSLSNAKHFQLSHQVFLFSLLHDFHYKSKRFSSDLKNK
jgi:hypothetical protein